MNASDIARYRLLHQQIALTQRQSAVEVVAGLGAMQAQDYRGALWSIGLRLPDATESGIELAIVERAIVRTWPLRGTLHFVAAADVHWLLALLTPRIIANSAHRFRRLELDDKILARGRKLFIRALQGNRQLTREAMLDLLERDGISTANLRGNHILWRLSQEAVICFAARSGKQHAFALLDEWTTRAKHLERDAALAELARRYFTSHGPATLQDFVWWTGLKVSDAKAGLDSVSSELARFSVDGRIYWMPRDLPDRTPSSLTVHLLPGFDEYLLGYKDRSAALDARHAQKIVPGGNGMFLSTLVINGRVAGVWKRVWKKKSIVITALPFARLKRTEKEAFATAAERYGQFVGASISNVGVESP